MRDIAIVTRLLSFSMLAYLGLFGLMLLARCRVAVNNKQDLQV